MAVERFTTVWDAAGVERRVRKVDAREIIAAGGSGEVPASAPVVTVADVGKAVDVDGNEVTEIPVYKSADTGEFVDEDFAEANPKTTYKTKRKTKTAAE
jgi:hypothetical protein